MAHNGEHPSRASGAHSMGTEYCSACLDGVLWHIVARRDTHKQVPQRPSHVHMRTSATACQRQAAPGGIVAPPKGRTLRADLGGYCSNCQDVRHDAHSMGRWHTKSEYHLFILLVRL